MSNVRSLFLFFLLFANLHAMRIVSLGPAVTNQLLLLDAGPQIVGKSIYCDKSAGIPDEVKTVGNMLNINVETVAMQKPDIIFASGLTPEGIIKKLRSVHLEVIVIDDPSNFDMLCDNFVTIGTAINKKEQAEEIVHSAKEEFLKLEQSLGTPRKVFFELGSKPLFSVTKGTLGDQLIELCGGVNIFDLKGSGVVNREEVLLKDPEVIFISEMGEASIKEKARWETFSQLSATKNNAVYVVDAYSIGSPTPRSFIQTVKEYRALISSNPILTPSSEISTTQNSKNLLVIGIVGLLAVGLLLFFGKRSMGLRRHLLLFSSLTLLLLLTLYIAAAVGGFTMTLSEMFEALRNSESGTKMEFFTKLRLPRIVAAFAVGSALALAGVTMQSLFSNPLVEPYTLGLSASSSLGVAIAVILGLQSKIGDTVLPIAAFIGAFPVLLFLLSPTLTKRFNEKELLLTGVMLSFITSSIVMFILSVADVKDTQTIMHWTFGSLNESTIESGLFLLVLGVLILIYLISRSFLLNALALGDEDALSVGVHVSSSRTKLLFVATILTAFAVSIAGLIGFMGLLIPHLVRLFTGLNHKVLLPTAWLTGGIVLIACDTLARTIVAPSELPVGVITGIAGGILFIALSRKRSHA